MLRLAHRSQLPCFIMLTDTNGHRNDTIHKILQRNARRVAASLSGQALEVRGAGCQCLCDNRSP